MTVAIVRQRIVNSATTMFGWCGRPASYTVATCLPRRALGFIAVRVNRIGESNNSASIMVIID